jgi:hypothetical protein
MDEVGVKVVGQGDIGIDPVTHRNSCHGNTGLLALLGDLDLEGFRV